MQANAERDEVTVTDSGLQYEVLESGSGDKPGGFKYRRVLLKLSGTDFCQDAGDIPPCAH